MKRQTAILLLILILAFGLRLYRIDNPLADWHSWRQVDTASVTREFVTKGIDLLHPTYHDLSNVPSGMDNPEGYRFVEFPIYNGLHAILVKYIGVFPLEVWGRLVTIFASVISTFFIFAITKKYAGVAAGLFAAFFYAVLPFSIYFGRTILPDPLMTASFLGSIYFFISWIDTPKDKKSFGILYFLTSLVLAAVSLLLKPFAGFFLLPIAAISYQAFGLGIFKKWQLYIFAALALLPLVLWRWWMLQFPEGIPTNAWLFNGGNIRFTGAFFYWIFAERIGKLMLGYFGAGILALGLFALLQDEWLKPLRKSKSAIFFAFLLSAIVYLVVVARGNVQHDYYQIPIVPAICMILGIGSAFVWNPLKDFNRLASRVLLSSFIILTTVFSWYYVRDFFNINNPSLVSAGLAVDRLTPKNAKVIALYDGDTSFLYQTRRHGWASLQNSLPEMIKKGAEYLVIVNPSDADRQGLGTEYETVSSDTTHLLLRLRN